MDLRREPDEDVVDSVGTVGIERDVCFSGGYGCDLRIGLDLGGPFEPVHESIGLCRRRPDLKVRVANQHELSLVGNRRLQHVGARTRDARFRLLLVRDQGGTGYANGSVSL